MAIYVNTNVSSLNTQNALSKATTSLDTTYERLSSGLRINSAKDDAAGLQISDRLTSQIDGLYQGNNNCDDGIALAQTMEGALDETTDMLQRIRTLAVQAANGTNSTLDRISIQQEVTQLCQEIMRIACRTTYAGSQCLAGAKGILDETGSVRFHVGAYAYDCISISCSTGFTLSGIMQISNPAFTNADVSSDGSDGMIVETEEATDEYGNYLRFSVTTQDNAEAVISAIDQVINNVDSKRAELGAIQNRMESCINNQSNIRTNVSDARSRIRDTDYAEETSNLTAEQMIQEAATTILTQANQRPQIAQTLLQGIG